jgi:hypothetical protein
LQDCTTPLYLVAAEKGRSVQTIKSTALLLPYLEHSSLPLVYRDRFTTCSFSEAGRRASDEEEKESRKLSKINARCAAVLALGKQDEN